MTTTTVTDRYLELIRRFPLRPIRSAEEHDHAITTVNSLVARMEDLGQDERDYLDVLGDLVERYESEIYPEPVVAPHEMIRELIAARGITQVDLARETGIAESVVSEIVCGKRKLGRKTIETLARYFHVDPGVFFAE